MLLASNFERGVGLWKPVNLAGSVTVTRVTDGTAYSGSAFLRVTTTDPGGSVAHDLSSLRRVPGTNDFWSDSNISVLAWVRTAPGRPNMSATLTIWQLGVDPANPANHPNTSFAVNSTWTSISNAIDMAAGSFDLRVEFYLDKPGTALDIDCVHVG